MILFYIFIPNRFSQFTHVDLLIGCISYGLYDYLFIYRLNKGLTSGTTLKKSEISLFQQNLKNIMNWLITTTKLFSWS